MTEEEKRKLILLSIQHTAKERQVQQARITGRQGGLTTARNRKLRKLQKYYQDGIL
jgi:hypothetical protein